MKLLQSVQILRLKPGDIIVVEVDNFQLIENKVEQLRAQVAEEFPGHQIVVTAGARIRVNREAAA